MADPQQQRGPDGSARDAQEQPIVRLQGVRKCFERPGGGQILALEIPMLELPRGGLHAVIGPNGSGKSTLLHLVAGLLRPDVGRLHVGGVELGTLREAQLDRFRAHNIGLLLQGGRLMESLSAEENLMAASMFAGRPRREQRERARGMLERLDIAHRARHLPSELSGGERQRVAMARALVNHPPLVLADEPFASLDQAGSASLTALFRGLVSEMGITLVVATHHPERLEADVVVQLEAER
jgi:putative ABC transport system ATP-binding protein